MTYNEQGKCITSENLAGQITTTAWDDWSVTYNCCKRSKATVVKRVHWETLDDASEDRGVNVKVNNISQGTLTRMDLTLKNLLKDGGSQSNCEKYRKDHPNDPVMETVVDLDFGQ